MYWYVTSWGWNAVWRRLKRIVLRREAEIKGQCRMCGRCCREIVLYVGGGWARSHRRFEKAKIKDPDLRRFEPVGKDEDGRIIFRCAMLGPEGLCSEYEDRLDMCRQHPNLGLYYSGVVLAPHCGYRLEGPTVKGVVRRLLGVAPPDFQATLERERKQAEQAAGKDINRDTGNESR